MCQVAVADDWLIVKSPNSILFGHPAIVIRPIAVLRVDFYGCYDLMVKMVTGVQQLIKRPSGPFDGIKTPLSAIVSYCRRHASPFPRTRLRAA